MGGERRRISSEKESGIGTLANYNDRNQFPHAQGFYEGVTSPYPDREVAEPRRHHGLVREERGVPNTKGGPRKIPL